MFDHEGKKYWFAAKRYGWGWGLPSSWQGWVVSFVYLAVIVALSFVFDSAEGVVPLIASMVVATALFLAICWKKGAPAKWRWGKMDDDSETKPE